MLGHLLALVLALPATMAVCNMTGLWSLGEGTHVIYHAAMLNVTTFSVCLCSHAVCL